jgi:signal transduction histidine kinase
MTLHNRSRSRLIVGLLVLTLGVTGLLAYQALEAARSHRETAEGVLRDYASLASWELSRQGQQVLLTRMTHGLDAVRTALRRGDLRRTADRASCSSSCANPIDVRSAFVVNLQDGRIGWSQEPDPAVAAALERVIGAGVRHPDAFTCPSFEIVEVEGQLAALVWRPTLDRANRATEVVGFVTGTEFIAQAFTDLVGRHALLPPSLTEAPGAPNQLLAVRVASASGTPLYTSSESWSDFAAQRNLARAYGGLDVAVALKPDAAGTLVIGGLPRERLPLIGGLLALTSGLVVVALVQMRREAEIARMRAEFVSGVSHELRTPLAQIRMFTDTLLLGRVRNDTESRRSLEIVSREATRLAQLVENVLLFARGERKRPEISCEPTAMAPLVGDVVDNFAPLAGARDARIVTDLQPGVMARVDPGAIRQVLLNLLDNAVKYGPAGGTVRVTLACRDGRARLVVRDEGAGVAPKDAARIWEPFQRAVGPDTSTGGTGIGLAIVRQLVELHGGTTRVEAAGPGARFVVELPDAWQDRPAPAAVA